MVVFVIGYDAFCKPGETLSEGADRWIEKHPWLARIVMAVIAAHVANVIPQRTDPIHRMFELTKKFNGREHG